MSSPRPFGDHRFIGDKRSFRVHDLERESDHCAIDDIVNAEKLLLFAPDTLAEARNRRFRPCPHCRP